MLFPAVFLAFSPAFSLFRAMQSVDYTKVAAVPCAILQQRLSAARMAQNEQVADRGSFESCDEEGSQDATPPQFEDVAFVRSRAAKDGQGVLWNDRTEQDLLRAVKRHEAYRTDRGVSRRWTSVRNELRAKGAFGGRDVPNWKTLRTKTERICDSRRAEVAWPSR